MSHHHAKKIKYFNFFFGFRKSFRGLTPSKLKDFDKKLKIANNTQNFVQRSFIESLINTSLHQAIKMKFCFFWILSLFSWANTFKTQEFRPKIEIFQQHSKFCTTLFLRKFN